MQAYNPSTQVKRLFQVGGQPATDLVPGQPRLYRETQKQKTKTKTNKQKIKRQAEK